MDSIFGREKKGHEEVTKEQKGPCNPVLVTGKPNTDSGSESVFGFPSPPVRDPVSTNSVGEERDIWTGRATDRGTPGTVPDAPGDDIVTSPRKRSSRNERTEPARTPLEQHQH